MAYPRSVVLCLLLLVVGCHERATAPKPSPADVGQLKGRLSAALGMANLNQRDDALKSVVEDAAAACDSKIALEALAAFTSGNLRDDTAAKAAQTLSAAGHAQEAADVAKLIASGNLRDEVLKKVAQGK